MENDRMTPNRATGRPIAALCMPAILLMGASLPAGASGARVKLPPVHRSELPNGLTVIIVEKHALPTVALSLTFRSGSADNPRDRAGLADLAGELALLGTGSRDADTIAEQVDSLGATLASTTDWDSASIAATSLAEDLGTMLGIVADVSRNPVFPDGELAQLKQRRLNELKAKLDNPSALASDAYASLLFPGSPYGFPEEGTTTSVGAVTRADLVAYHASHWVPNNAILVIVGDVNPGTAADLVGKAFGTWEKKPLSSVAPPAVKGPEGVRIVLMDKPDVTQTQVRIGHLGVARDNPDWFPLQVANYILGGGGFSSRLMDRIRVQKGYTYGLRSGFDARIGQGPFTISSFTPQKTVAPLLSECLEVIGTFVEEGPGEQELADARNFFVSGYPRSFETPAGIARALLEVEIYGLGEKYIETYQDRYAAVTAEDVKRVSKKYFDTRNLLVVAVTNPAEVRESLLPLGKVEVVPLQAP